MFFLSRREFLNVDPSLSTGGKSLSRREEKFPPFRSISKSQEVLNAALGGAPMKRMVNGAVSDISHALQQQVRKKSFPTFK